MNDVMLDTPDTLQLTQDARRQQNYLASTVCLRAEIAGKHIALQLIGRRLAQAQRGISNPALLVHTSYAAIPDAASTLGIAVSPFANLAHDAHSDLKLR